MKAMRNVLLLLVFSALTVAAHAQDTSLLLNSDGDFVGQGQTTFLTPADGTFSASKNFDNGVSVFFRGQPGIFWELDFAAPSKQLLTVGTYTGAARFGFQAFDQPGLNVTGDGRGCNTVTGSFTVLEVSYGASNTIDAFDATFEQHCEGATTALRGEIRFNAHPVVTVFATSQLNAIINQNVNFTVTATDAESRHVVLTATGVPAGATFVDNGDNTGTFNWTPTDNQLGTYFVSFLGNNLSGDTAVAVTKISVIPPPPPNDDFDQATVVPSMPFTVSEDATNATVAPDDPFCAGRSQTVWFAFTPSQDIRIEANTFGSNYDTTLSVYTGNRGALTLVGCDDTANGTLQSRVRFDAVAGTTYHFMVSSFSTTHPSPANLVFNLLLAPPLLSVTPSVTQFGAVDPTTGTATISGSVSCSHPAFVILSGQLKQTLGNKPITGFFSVFVPCNGTTPWSTTIQTTTALFHGRTVALFTGGKADVTATASAFDFDNGVFVREDLAVTIILQGTN